MAKIYALLSLLLLPAPAWAEAELFATTEATPWPGFHKAITFNSIEPASGDTSQNNTENLPQKGIPTDAPDTDAHADVSSSSITSATDKALAPLKADDHEAKKERLNEKDLGTTAPKKDIPTVTIGGREIVTYRAKTANDISESTPADLQGPVWKEILDHRFNLTPYAHDPILGSAGAPIQVVIFEDLSCGQCLPTLGEMDAALAAYTSQTQVVHVHAPLGRLQDTNLPAFYGKVASRMGKFWQYRSGLISAKASTPDAVLDTLLKTGVRERDVRSLMMTDARRFYREMDADILLARTYAVGQPPVVFVNGIRVGTGGIPLDKFADVLRYVSARIARGLPEPPL